MSNSKAPANESADIAASKLGAQVASKATSLRLRSKARGKSIATPAANEFSSVNVVT
jgi:hypothetical protein